MYNHEDAIEFGDGDDTSMDTKEDGNDGKSTSSSSSRFSFYSGGGGDSKEEKKPPSSLATIPSSKQQQGGSKKQVTSDAIYDRLKIAEINLDDPLDYEAAERLLDKEKEEYRKKSRAWVAKNNKQFQENAKPSHQEELEGDVEKQVLEGLVDRNEQPIFHKAADKRALAKNPLDDDSDDEQESHKSTSTKNSTSNSSMSLT